MGSPSPVAAIRASVSFASTPGRVEQPTGGECGAGLDRQGGDIGDLHPPGARPDVQAHLGGLSPAIGD